MGRRGMLWEYTALRLPDTVVLLGAYCPACKFEHAFRVHAPYWAEEGKDYWTFDGNYDSPTFTGSMLSTSPDRTSMVCHSFLTKGVWNFLSDCTHKFAGQKLPMIPYPDEYHAY